MTIGILSMQVPLAERIDRWATSGKATKIPLLPEDYVKIAKKVEAIEEEYKLPITIIGGQKAMNTYLRLTEEMEKDEREAIFANLENLADLNDVFQSEE